MDTLKHDDLFDTSSSEKDDDKLFMEEEETAPKKKTSKSVDESKECWKVLVVDDEEDIHSVTRMSLKGFTYKDKGIEFLHTYSGKESEPVLHDNPDIAVILLDVVMETNTAGLDLVKFIRDKLNNRFAQIILRTGYPGYAPEREIIVSYDINDYKTKTELTSFKLFTLILASLRAYDAITSLEQLRLGLEDKVKERTAELEHKNLQIMEMDQMKTRFFANISHEFRTPLTLILGPLEDILAKEEMKEKNRVTMERMHRSAARLLALINQLLDLSKLDAGSMKLELVESDVLRFLRIIFSSFTPLADRKKIDYKFAIPEQKLVTTFDQDKIEKILYNLLSNAFKFTPDEGEIWCKVSIGKSNDLQISVKDSGSGIPSEMIEKIFDRFYQVEGTPHGQAGGTGIGLSLTRELIQIQHGQIKINSKTGEGSEFIVTIPLGHEHLKKDEFILRDETDVNESFVTIHAILPGKCAESEGKADEDEEDSTKPQILVVEDSEDVRSHIAEGLDDRYVLKMAENGKIGYEIGTETIPDLIITDLMMPEMDGVELCKMLKTDERTSHIPVIMLTAKASVENRLEGLETGADDYMTKPFNMQELQIRINNLIEQRRKLRERFSKDARLEPKDIAVTSPDEKFLNRTMNIIEENLGDCDFEVTDLADEVGMSRMQLFRKLKALTDQTPSEFIRTIRLKRAARLMEKKFGNIAEITYEVGFNNLSYFAKCFKEMYGQLPSEYVKSH
ncbi:MAG: response regulator [Bacteroidales bacterium]|nr:response regulator [Bacteroidales bacterium]